MTKLSILCSVRSAPIGASLRFSNNPIGNRNQIMGMPHVWFWLGGSYWCPVKLIVLLEGYDEHSLEQLILVSLIAVPNDDKPTSEPIR